jgi:hypothetical protein
MAADDEPKALFALLALALALYAVAWAVEERPAADGEPLGDAPAEDATPARP